MSEDIKLGKYKHYKGNLYQVLGIAVHSETLEEFVLYKPLYKTEKRFEGKFWIRPKNMFKDFVSLDGKKIPRFEFVE